MRVLIYLSLCILIGLCSCQRPAIYVRASDAEKSAKNRQLSFASQPSDQRFADVGSPANVDTNLDESARALMQQQQAPVPAAVPASRPSNLDESAKALMNSQQSSASGVGKSSWVVPPAVPEPAAPSRPMHEIPTFEPMTLPPNEPILLPQHNPGSSPIRQEALVLPPGYKETGDGGFISPHEARDQPRRSADISPSEITDGRSLAAYMLAKQYGRAGDG